MKYKPLIIIVLIFLTSASQAQSPFKDIIIFYNVWKEGKNSQTSRYNISISSLKNCRMAKILKISSWSVALKELLTE
jgi:hypothetical protein